jgi:Predicted integral membrane protein
MNCPSCQQGNAGDARFCASCGAPLSAAVAGTPPDAAQTSPLPFSRPTAAAAAPSAAWPPSQTQMAGLIERVRNIVLQPRSEWTKIAPEPTSVMQLFLGYVMPLAGISALISLIRMSIIGISLPFGGTLRSPLTAGITVAIFSFAMALVSVFVLALIVNALASTFAGTRDQRQALKVTAYAMTPAWLGAVFGLLPMLGTLLGLVASIYAIYLLYLGLPILMRSPQDKAAGYTALVVVCAIVLGILIGVVSATVGGFGLAGMHGGALGALGGYPQTQEQQQQQAANTMGNAIGGMLGTDDKGKAGLGAAINQLAQAGQQIQQHDAAGGAGQANGNGGTPDATDAQTAVGAAGGLMSALGGALGGSHRVTPVDFRTLQTLLPPSLSGMQRGVAQGSDKQGMGIKTSSAEADYSGAGDARIHVTISDVSGVSGLIGMAGDMAQTTDAQTATGYEKDVTIDGRSVHEKYDSANKHGEMQVIVAQRYAVDVDGDNVDMDALQQALGQVDLARLESMKDANPQAQ